MKLIILGSRGLLGNYAYRYFTGKCDVIGLERKDIDVMTDSFESDIRDMISQDDVLINCIGLLKPMINENDIMTAFTINSILPNILAYTCYIKGAKLIHICSDCVFSGNRGSYVESDIPDGEDIYAISKSTRNTGTTIRTSFVGTSMKTDHCGLINWLLRQPSGSTVKGYVNCMWNGITCLQLCESIETMITNNIFWSGVRHVFTSKTITKYDLCRYIIDIYGLDIKLTAHETTNIEGSIVDSTLDRSLSSCWSDHLDVQPLINIKQQIIKQYEYGLPTVY